MPRLLYLGDVPVESSLYGAALLYRLLGQYPAGDLVILEANPWKSNPRQRLPSVSYKSFPLGNARWLNSRFHRLYGWFIFAGIRAKWHCVDQLLGPFEPEAVLTVTHGLSWIAAAEYAGQKRVPLHLILHDDWPSRSLLPGLVSKPARRRFGNCYRRAASRLCISPAMAQVYRQEWLAPATALYPCADANAEVFRTAPERLSTHQPPLVIGFGGTISSPGQARVVRLVAETLCGCGGKLLVYGPMTPEQIRAWRLDLPNTEWKGLISSSAMVQAFRENADALLVPVSFCAQDRRQSVMSFPSKLADYTRAALPLLIVAPEYSSLVRWAGTADPFAEIVTSESDELVRAAIERLIASATRRLHLAARAHTAHENYFSHARAWTTFRTALAAHHQPAPEPLSPPASYLWTN